MRRRRKGEEVGHKSNEEYSKTTKLCKHMKFNLIFVILGEHTIFRVHDMNYVRMQLNLVLIYTP